MRSKALKKGNIYHTRRSLILTLSVIVSMGGYAQTPAYTTYTMEEGLPSLWVYDIIQANDGAIWFATDNGVSRFDGYEFESFGVAEGLPHPDVFVLHEDEKGRIWCGVMNNELCYIEKGNVVRSKHADKLSTFFNGTAIIQGIEERDGQLFIAYKNRGLVQIHRNGEIEQMGDEYGFHVLLTGKNENLVGKIRYTDELTPLNFKVLIYDERGLLTEKDFTRMPKKGSGVTPKMASFGGIDSLKIVAGSFSLLLYDDRITIDYPKDWRNQIIRSDGWLWEGSQTEGIHISNADRNQRTLIFSGKTMVPELRDKDGNVWVVEMGEGVYCFKPLRVWNYANGKELYDGNIHRIASRRNQLAIGYKDGGVEKIDLTNTQKYWFKKGGDYIKGLHWLDNSLYAFSSLGVTKFDKENTEGELIISTYTMGPLTRNLPANAGKRVVRYKSSIYSMTGSLGVCLWDAGSLKTLLSSAPYGPFRSQDQLVDNDLNVWLTSEKGIYLFDLSTERLKPFVENISVAGIVQLYNNDIWCSDAKGGIFHFIPSARKVSKVDLGEVANETFIKQLRIDKHGIIWGTSNKGLFRIDPTTKKSILITKSDGLLSNLLTDITIDNDRVLVSSSKGVSFVNINEVFKSTTVPLLSISNVWLNGKRINSQMLKNLTFDENNLEFNFKAIGFETPGAYHYRYRLKVLNDEWQYTSELKALFLSIPYGSYQFEVEVLDPRGAWSVCKSLEIIISPPFWKTWWFFGGTALLTMALLFLIYKRRIHKIEQTSKLKNEIRKFQQHAMTAQMNPHFIFNSLNSIQRFIIENERLIANQYLVKFSGLMRITLENSKKIWVPIDEETKALKLYLELESLRFKSKLNWTLEIAEEIDQSCRIPTLLIQPFVENSICHGLMPKKEGGTVTIRIGQKSEDVFCEVVDDGIGRLQAEKLKSKEHTTIKSTGISITQKRLALLHDKSSTAFEFSIEDRKDLKGNSLGTSVYFTIPIIE